MSKTTRTVTLSARSKRGKQIIKQHGATWEITAISITGRINIRPVGEVDTGTVCNSRWVRLSLDLNFDVSVVEMAR